MKENNRNSKYTHKKHIILSKKEIKIVNHILDFEKVNKQNLSNNTKKNPPNKKPSPNKLEPIKVRLTPINRRFNSKGKKNLILKDSNLNTNKNNKFNNSAYISPIHKSTFKKGNITQIKLEKKINFTESRHNIKEEKEKMNRNCSTPYRRILNIKPKEDFSPSTSVIIKNFNYNNVYNINIDNEKIPNNKSNKFNKKTIAKNYKDNNFDINNTDNESIIKYSSKDTIGRKFTYNKPKTSSSMNGPYALSKRNKSKDTSINTENNKIEENNSLNKNDTVFSRFITEGNSIKNCRNINLPIFGLISKASIYENKENKNNFNETPDKNKTMNNNFSLSTKKSSLNDYNIAVQTINNNLNNNTYSNNFINTDSNSNQNYNTTGINNFYNTTSLSLNNTNINRYLIKSPKNNNNKYNKNNIIEKNININSFNKNNNNNTEDKDKDFIFNLKDLFIFEDRINDIVSAFNKTNNIYDIEASNECNEFINFYSKSSLIGIFSTFFKENNKLIIESSINLSLFFISIIYNLSTNNFLFNDLISTINNILSCLKINFALYIKKIQIYYGENIIKKNYIYFQPFNTFLNNNNIKDIVGEDDITYKIYQNCRLMTNEIKIIMKYYQKIDMNYYNYFIKIFNNISIQKETDLLNNFFTSGNIKLNNSFNLITVNKSNNNLTKNNLDVCHHHKLKKNKTNVNLGYFSPYKKEKLSFKTPDKIYLKSPMRAIKIENKSKNKIDIPYIKTPTDRKYTLVLDLNKTLAFNNNNNVSLRTGLFSFLSMIKPYYELISFSCDPNDISDKIVKEIEYQKKYFDYNFKREHSILYENTLVKDISLIGRDISKIIIIDDDENCFKLNKENGIKIKAFNGSNKNDNVLFELKKILILIHKKSYDDVRIAIKDFSHDIKNKISWDYES